MGDPKPLASLTSGLLARKGQAAPAMRRQSMMLASTEQNPIGHHNPLEDLGWNDMGEDDGPSRTLTGLSPMQASPEAAKLPAAEPQPIQPDLVDFDQVEPPAVVRQQEELAREVAKPYEPAEAPVFEPVAEKPAVEEAVAEAAPESAPVFVEEVPQQVAPELASKPKKAAVVRAAPGSRGKAAFTLRLDGQRHLQLRLVCAVNHRSAQQIVTQALDEFLSRQPSIEDLASGRGSAN